MANTNLTGNGTKVLDTRLWAGSPADSTAWLQSPIGSNAAVGTMNMAVVQMTIDDGDAASSYDLALATNPVTGTEIIAVLGIFSDTAGANAVPVAGNVSTGTEIKFTGAGANGADTVYRLVFLYR
tara:strand:+ start:252 stop:626 length:375 start_codon:yes stop_codon:yes gene_type:complete